MADDRPIGIFDSGIGGLTVLREIHLRFPDEELLYLGDTARVPYGSKSKDTVVRYTRNNIGFLEAEGVKLVVVACNTASAYALPEMKEHKGAPVVGVIQGGVEAAVKITRGRIGVIGTEATINSNAYQNALARFSHGIYVMARACPMFVPLVEEGWVDNDIARAVAHRYLADLRGQVDTLVLGCTHYPMLKETISQTLGEGTRLIDSAEETARMVGLELDRLEMRASEKKKPPRVRFYVTDSPKRSMEVARRMLGQIDVQEAEYVDII
ncbi:MAG: glutamate racemase [Nitrospinota bacterium]|nr:glutamate racemase [Nitrospinota bacterium]